MVQRIAHAKINLALHVTGQREDGYHLLDSLVTFTDYGDIISVSEPHHAHGPIAVSIDGFFSEGLTAGPENLVTAAAFLLREAVIEAGISPQPVEITLTKNLPVASGIGGGSADAAATLLTLQEFWKSDIQLEQIAFGLGADVPMCLHSKPLRACGIGNEIDLLRCGESHHMVLVNPGIGVSTPEVFKNLTSKTNMPIEFDLEGQYPSIKIIGRDMRNNLERPAMALCPQIEVVLDVLAQQDANLVRMSGSGATCFGIFDSKEQTIKACENIRSEYPDWWCVATQTTVT